MGDINYVDSLAMESVVECLENAATDMLLIGLNWPEHEEDSLPADLGLHVESARLWAGSVSDRLTVWAKRARRICAAVERHQARRLT